MTLMRYMFREMRRRPARTVLTLFGIVIGVQSLVAIPITIQSTRRAHRELFEGLTGRAALEVVPCGQGGFAPELAVQLEALKGSPERFPLSAPFFDHWPVLVLDRPQQYVQTSDHPLSPALSRITGA